MAEWVKLTIYDESNSILRLINIFMGRDQITAALEGHQLGTCIVSFSEAHPGLFVIGYVNLAILF